MVFEPDHFLNLAVSHQIPLYSIFTVPNNSLATADILASL